MNAVSCGKNIRISGHLPQSPEMYFEIPFLEAKDLIYQLNKAVLECAAAAYFEYIETK